MMPRLFRALSVLGMTLLMSAGLTVQAAAAERPRSAVILAHAGASSGTAQPSDPMPGMDMNGTDSSGSMPGMDMNGTDSSGSMPGMKMPGPGGTSGGASSHPRGLLLGGFAVLNVAVLLGAARLRRRGKTTRPRRAVATD